MDDKIPTKRSLRQHRLTKARQQIFLEAYARGETITESARLAKIDRKSIDQLKDRDEKFLEQWIAADNASTDLLVREARRRALEGVLEPTGWYKGEPGGHVLRYSDNLLMFLLKERRPEFRDKFELTGQGGQPLQIQLAAYTAPEGISNRTSQKQKPKEPDPGAPPAIEVEAKGV